MCTNSNTNIRLNLPPTAHHSQVSMRFSKRDHFSEGYGQSVFALLRAVVCFFFFEELKLTVFDDAIGFVSVSGIKREAYLFIIFRLNPRRDRGNN